jgi:hypothetical protein
MKRSLSISLIILLLSTTHALSAQTKKVGNKTKAPISFDSLIIKKLTNRIEIGYNNPARYGSGVSTTYFNGVKIGLTTELEMKNNLSLLTGVLYNLVYSDKLQRYPGSTHVNYLAYGHFINIPVMVGYNFPITKDLKFSAFAGPTLNIGLSQIGGDISTEPTISSAYADFYNSSLLNRLDLQIGVGAAVQFKKYQLKAGYDYGLLNVNKSSGNLYQKGWYVSLSINF